MDLNKEKVLTFLTNPFGAALALTVILLVIYFVSVSVCLVPNIIRFALLTFGASAAVFYINNHYLVNNFSTEPVIDATFEEVVGNSASDS